MSYPNPENPISESDSSEQKAVFLKSVILPSNPLVRIVQVRNKMSLSKKIKYGYILTVGIAVLGSTISLAIGDYYYYQAKQQKNKITQESRLLNNLRYTIFELKTITSTSSSVGKIDNLHKAKAVAIKSNTEVKAALEKISVSPTYFSIPEVKELLNKYGNTIEKIYQNLDTTLNQIETLKPNQDKIPQTKEILTDFTTIHKNHNLLDLADDLEIIRRTADRKEQEANSELIRAEIQRIFIIFIGISLSLIVTYLLSSYMMIIITYPLQRIKKNTQKAIEESDLELELSINYQDEITQIGSYLDQLISKNQSLMVAHKETEKAFDIVNKAKKRFMANISHELLTPLNGILGYTQVLQNSQNIAIKEKRGIQVIHKCAEHLLMLINDIIDFSKIESNKIELSVESFNLLSFLQEIIEIYRIQAREKGILFSYELPNNLPIGITTDKKRLRQVIVNLLGNAIKFTERGSVKLQVEFTKSSTAKVKINFAVQDTGIGISHNNLEKIFLPFEQVVDSRTHKDGTGLGLSISQKIVELMGSHIEVNSELGKGSNFQFTINCPIAEDWTEVSVITIPETKKIIGYFGEPKKILVVDERWEHRSLIVNMLEPIGFYIIEANDGEEGLAKAHLYHPDLIISDIYMPILDGWEMLSHIRSSNNLKDIPVILTFTSIFDKEEQKITYSEANDFLNKPIQSEQLYYLLKRELKINWKYENSENIQLNTLDKNQQVSIVFPPASELIMLLDYAKKGQIKGIIKELENIANIDKEYQGFVNHLNLLIKDFNIKNIRSFLNENIRD